jgi:hypothetical protein
VLAWLVIPGAYYHHIRVINFTKKDNKKNFFFFSSFRKNFPLFPIINPKILQNEEKQNLKKKILCIIYYLLFDLDFKKRKQVETV